MENERLVIYCLIPADQSRALLGPLRKHYADDPRVQVIVDRRVRQRRAGDSDFPPSPAELDRRSGSDRRRPVLPRSLKPLPARLAAKSERVRYVQRMLPVSGELQAVGLEAVAARARAGDPEAPTELYWRLYERVHSRLCVLLGDVAAADVHVAGAFGRILDALEAEDAPIDDLLYAAIDAGVSPVLDEEEAEPLAELGRAPSLAVSDPDLDEPVTVQDRDPRWFGRAMSERDRLLRVGAGHVEAIEHVGATAVPAVAGRPVIDLMIGVPGQPSAELIAALKEVGYVDCGAAGTPGRRLLRRRSGGRFDVHVVVHEGELWNGAIELRDYLRRRPTEAHRWAMARREAARSAPTSYIQYAELRAPALAELLERVHASRSESPQDAGSPSQAA